MSILSHISRLWTETLKALFYPKCKIKSPVTFWTYVLPQKILNMNQSRNSPWPVHYTSSVVYPDRIRITGPNTAPGRAPGCYIQAVNGIEMGSDVYIAPGVKIISANHSPDDLDTHILQAPIRIGSHCWIGANAIILPGVILGDYVIVGAGAVVTHNFPSHCTIAGVPARVIQPKIAQTEDTLGIDETVPLLTVNNAHDPK